jgi:ABC-type nickel/cobalt efflux system permease component RcnA
MYVSEDTLGAVAILLIAAIGSFSIWKVMSFLLDQNQQERPQKQQESQQQPATNRRVNPQAAGAAAQ